MKRTAESEKLPIDEVDAQTLYFTIRALHERGKTGVLLAIFDYIGDILRGEKWGDRQGDSTQSLKTEPDHPA